MRLTVSDLRQVQLKKLPAVRFNVNVAADNGDPLWTCEGWLMNDLREIYPPGVMTRWGMKRYHKTAPRFIEMLRAAIEKNFPAIDEVLGRPKVEGMEEEEQKLKGEGEIL